LRSGGVPFGVEIALVVEDVPAAYARATAAGAAAVLEPVVKPWGQTVAYVRDGDGALVELCTAMD
jgi:lactoylglutathione lyase